jgi:hypothetical protein
MRKSRTLLLVLIVALTACQKESSTELSPGGTSGGSITGTWKLLQMEAKTTATAILSIPSVGTIKTVTVSDYTTTDNEGVLKIDERKMDGVGLAYSLNTVVKAYTYEDNVLTDSIEAPMSFTLPPTNYSAAYTKVGADSIRIEAGGVMDIQGSGSVAAQPGGFKFKVEGNKLVLSTVYSDSQTETDSGITQTLSRYATLTSTYQRQ